MNKNQKKNTKTNLKNTWNEKSQNNLLNWEKSFKTLKWKKKLKKLRELMA